MQCLKKFLVTLKKLFNPESFSLIRWWMHCCNTERIEPIPKEWCVGSGSQTSSEEHHWNEMCEYNILLDMFWMMSKLDSIVLCDIRPYHLCLYILHHYRKRRIIFNRPYHAKNMIFHEKIVNGSIHTKMSRYILS